MGLLHPGMSETEKRCRRLTGGKTGRRRGRGQPSNYDYVCRFTSCGVPTAGDWNRGFVTSGYTHLSGQVDVVAVDDKLIKYNDIKDFDHKVNVMYKTLFDTDLPGVPRAPTGHDRRVPVLQQEDREP